MPFHDSTRVLYIGEFVWSASAPTARQAVALVHDTPSRPLMAAPGSGVATTDDDAPFHDSARASAVVPTSKLPTAWQAVALVQETDTNPFRYCPGWG